MMQRVLTAAICLASILSIGDAALAREDAKAPVAPEAPLAHVEKRGSGPVQLLLIPGHSCDWTVYETFMERNKDAYTMYAVTLPGFGGTASPPAPTDPADIASTPWLNNAEKQIVELISRESLEKPVILGHSLGGHLVCRIAARHPDLITSAIAVDGMPAFPMGSSDQPMSREQRSKMATLMFKNLEATKDEAWNAQQRGWIMQLVTDPKRGEQLADLASKTTKSAGARYMAELIASDVTDEVKASRIPVALFAALPPDGTPGMTPDSVRRVWAPFTQDAPHVSVVFFDSTRHFIMDDAPAEFDRSVAQFIKGEQVQGKVDAPPAGPKAPGVEDVGPEPR